MKITEILYEITEDRRVLNPDCELLESGILDSLALILLVERLEDEGIELNVARIEKERFKTPAAIRELVEEHLNSR